jgi:hypothetical protein
MLSSPNAEGLASCCYCPSSSRIWFTRKPSFDQNLRGEAFLLAQPSKQQVLGTDMVVSLALRLSPALARTRLHSLLRGRLTEEGYEVFSLAVLPLSIGLRMDSTEE